MTVHKQTSPGREEEFFSSKKKAAPPSPDDKHGPAKKHPKKHDPKHDHKHDPKKDKGKHLLRAYEHLGRVEAMQAARDGKPLASIALLRREAERQLKEGSAHAAADLLRAAEHLGFADAARVSTPVAVTPELEQAIQHEFEKKAEKASRHMSVTASELGQLALQSLESARAALDQGSFREALELVRAAEALAELAADGLDESSPDGSPLPT